MKKEELFRKHLECVAILAEIAEECILSRSRDTPVVRARNAVAKLCMRDGMSDAEICVFLNRERTTIWHMRNAAIPSFKHDTMFQFYVNMCYVEPVLVLVQN